MKSRIAVLCAASVFVAGASVASAATADQWSRQMAAAGFAYQQGDYAAAATSLGKAIIIAQSFGPMDPRLAQTLNDLGLTYFLQGRFGKASPLHLQALAMRERALGPDHPDVASSLNDLAFLYGIS